MSLSAKTCTACKGNEPTLKESEIGGYLEEVSAEWKVKKEPDRIARSFEFSDFTEALDFVNGVGEIAEKEGHHPDIRLYDYKMVEVVLWTHKIGGLHENDFIMAAKIDELAKN